jgi:hypothetical protein
MNEGSPFSPRSPLLQKKASVGYQSSQSPHEVIELSLSECVDVPMVQQLEVEEHYRERDKDSQSGPGSNWSLHE